MNKCTYVYKSIRVSMDMVHPFVYGSVCASFTDDRHYHLEFVLDTIEINDH